MNPVRIRAIYRRLQQANPDPKTELTYSTPFELLVAVMLSAHTTDRSVNAATKVLYPIANTAKAILDLGEDGVKPYIKPVGMYNQKAKNLIELCRRLVELHGGDVPNDREALESLPGVGRKTANVILNIVFGHTTIAVDTHIFRVSNRTGIAPGKDPLAVEAELNEVTPDEFKHNAHHWLLLHGRYVCIARLPACPKCIIRDLCEYEPKTPEKELPKSEAPVARSAVAEMKRAHAASTGRATAGSSAAGASARAGTSKASGVSAAGASGKAAGRPRASAAAGRLPGRRLCSPLTQRPRRPLRASGPAEPDAGRQVPTFMAIFAGQSREQLRRMYLEAWRKFSAKQPLEPLEAQLAAVIVEHPEYVQWLEAGDAALAAEFTPERGEPNPFLHMGMHLAIREQVATDRPRGIAEIHRKLAAKLGDAHAAEHAMLEPLGQALWEAQRANRMPDEQAYLERLKMLL